MKKNDLILFIQNYLSKLVSYDDDDNFFYFFSYVERYFSLEKNHAIQITIDIYYRLVSLDLIELHIKGESIKKNIVDLIHHADEMESFGGWFWYFSATEKAYDLIDKFNLYDNYYDEKIICKEFYLEFMTLLEENGLGIDIYPLVDIGSGGRVSLN
ncbi:hypothetical protein GVX76_10865 [[Haemophilus] felis]|nr:hypothetical protein [[Haemophilus] felis]